MEMEQMSEKGALSKTVYLTISERIKNFLS